MRKEIAVLAAILSVCASFTSLAGQWRQVESGWTYENDDGSIITNDWFQDPSNNWNYHFDSDGIMQTGKQKIGDYEYYFDTDGALVYNCQIPTGEIIDFNGHIVDTSKGATIVFKPVYDDEKTGDFIVCAVKNIGAEEIYVDSTCIAITDGLIKEYTLIDLNTGLPISQGIVKPGSQHGFAYFLTMNDKFTFNDTTSVRLNFHHNGEFYRVEANDQVCTIMHVE